jgi:hypothetical protein
MQPPLPLLPLQQSKRYSHGVRLAKAHDLDKDLMNLAFKSNPAVMIDAADYLFQKVGLSPHNCFVLALNSFYLLFALQSALWWAAAPAAAPSAQVNP